MTSPRTFPAHRLALGAAGLVLALAGCAAPSSPAPAGTATSSSTAPGTTTPPAPLAPPTRTARPESTASGTSAGAAASSPGGGTEKAAPGTALAALDGLPVKGRAPKTGYSRDEFGPRWADTDHNGCDTRNDILRRDLTGITVKPGTHGCKVSAGTLVSVYTGGVVDFVAGQDTSAEVQIDHVVALSDAWQKGAQQLDAARRAQLANDPLNLLAVDGPSNNQKSDGDAATWLPPATGERCEYVATQIAVKTNYALWVTDAEKKAMATVLQACPEQGVPGVKEVPAPGNAPEAAAPAPAAPAEPVAPAVPAAPAAPAGDGAYFARCADARAAGMAPLHAGSPGYRPGLDGDGDGVACEAKR